MAEPTDFETLALLCKRASSLPALPVTVIRLIHEIDDGQASAVQLERIISSDPALCASFLRWSAMEDIDGNIDPADCIRGSILVLGHRAVRHMAVSMMVQSALRSPVSECDFDIHVVARHSIFVGILARYVALRGQNDPRCIQDASEVYAAGVLHELPLHLLARLAPNVYNRVDRYARKRELSLHRAFEMLFDHPIWELGAISCDAWRLPPVFGRYMRGFEQPWMAEELERGVSSILYADWLANQTEWRLEQWNARDELPREVAEEVEIPEAELELVLKRIGEMAEWYYLGEPKGSLVQPKTLLS